MKIKLFQLPVLYQMLCSECGQHLMAVLAEDKKAITYLHYASQWTKCSQSNRQCSLAVELESIELDAEAIPEKST